MGSAGFSLQSLRVGFEIHAHYNHAQFLRLNSGTVSHPETELPALAVHENHLGAYGDFQLTVLTECRQGAAETKRQKVLSRRKAKGMAS